MQSRKTERIKYKVVNALPIESKNEIASKNAVSYKEKDAHENDLKSEFKIAHKKTRISDVKICNQRHLYANVSNTDYFDQYEKPKSIAGLKVSKNLNYKRSGAKLNPDQSQRTITKFFKSKTSPNIGSGILAPGIGNCKWNSIELTNYSKSTKSLKSSSRIGMKVIENLVLENDSSYKPNVDIIDGDIDRISLESNRKVENAFDLMMLGDAQKKTSGMKATEGEKSPASKSIRKRKRNPRKK